MKMDDLVKTYIQVREKKSQLKAKYDLDKAKYDELQNKIEALLLIKFGEIGVDSVKTDQGTAYTATHTSASIADWDTFFGFVKEHQAYELIERRVSKAAVEQYKSANEDLPPGINYSETRVVNFRKS
jgi:hypothetical protein